MGPGRSVKVRCPICRNDSRFDGTVVRKYQPQMQAGKVQGELRPLCRDTLHCRQCDTALLERVDGEWRQVHRIK